MHACCPNGPDRGVQGGVDLCLGSERGLQILSISVLHTHMHDGHIFGELEVEFKPDHSISCHCCNLIVDTVFLV